MPLLNNFSRFGICLIMLFAASTAFSYNTPPSTDPVPDGYCDDGSGAVEGDCGESGPCGGPGPDGTEKGATWIDTSYTDAPDVLPSLGESLALEMVCGGRSHGNDWGQHIGFGPQKPLNYLHKVHLTSDLRFARVFWPDKQATSAFERNGDSWEYTLVEKETGVGESTKVIFQDRRGNPPQVAADGSVDFSNITVQVLFPDATIYKFEFEAYDDPGHHLPGPVFRITERVHREGYVSRINYNQNNVTLIDASGHRYVCSFNDQNRITKIRVEGRSWDYTYDDTTNTVTETNKQTGKTIATTLDNRFQVTSFVTKGYTSEGKVDAVDVTYNEYYGDLLEKEIHNGMVTKVTHTRDGDEYTHVKEIGTPGSDGYIKKTFIVGRNGLKEFINGAESSTTYSRTDQFRKSEKIDALGRTWSSDYDHNGYLLEERSPESVVRSYTYGDAYNIQTKTEAGLTTIYNEYDANNRLLKETAPNGQITMYHRYPETGLVQFRVVQVQSIPSIKWAATYFEYNENGQVLLRSSPYEVSDPDNPNFPPDYLEDPNNVVGHRYTYDTWGNTLTSEDRARILTRYTYNSHNKVESVTNAAGLVKTYEYDGIGRKRKVYEHALDGITYTTTIEYDTRGFVKSVLGSNNAGGGCSCSQASGGEDKLGYYFYADSGKLLKFTDVRNTNPIPYDEDTDRNDAYSTYYEYDVVGRQEKIINPVGDVTKKEYYDDNKVKLVQVDPEGLNIRTYYTYHDDAQLESVTRGYGTEEAATTTYTYARDTITSRLLTMTVTAPDEGTTTIYYDEAGRVENIENARNISTSFVYDFNRSISITEASGTSDETIATFEYDIEDRVTSTTRDTGGLNAVTITRYDDAGRLKYSIVDPDDLRLITHYEYLNPLGKQSKVTLPKGYVSEYEYDEFGRQEMSKKKGVIINTTYDGNTERIKQKSDGLVTTDYTYDDVGNLGTMTVSGRATVIYNYNAANQLEGITQNGGSTTPTDPSDDIVVEARLYYNAAGRLVTLHDPKNNTIRCEYDALGRRTKLTNGEDEYVNYDYEVISGTGLRITIDPQKGSDKITEYDLLGRVTLTAGGPEGNRSFQYDKMNRINYIYDADNKFRRNDYDRLGRILKYYDEAGEFTEFRYDIAGRQTWAIDAKSNATEYRYNKGGQLEKTIYPEVANEPANIEELTYYSNGTLKKRIKPDGAEIRYSYYPHGRLHTVITKGADPEEVMATYTYDAAGDVTSDGTMHYTYNDLGQKTTSTDDTNHRTIRYFYDDARGFRTGMAVSDLMTVGYTYDDAGRLETVQKSGESSPTIYGYDPAGKRTSTLLPNGVKTTYRYLAGNDRLDRVRTTDKNGALLAKEEILKFNAVGMPKTVEKRYRVKDASYIWKQGSTSIHYDYDDAYRLELESRTVNSGTGGAQPYIESFKYDKVGNREQRTKNGITTDYVYNERNQVTTETTGSEVMTYEYDKNGNRRYVRNIDGVLLKEMQYDELNRMVSWTAGTNTESTTYRGSQWQRSSYTANGNTTNFLYDGANVVADLVADPSNPGSYLGSRVYVTPGLDQNVSMTDIATGDAFYYTADRRSSITTLTDANSAQVNAYDYSAMGERLASTVEGIQQRYQYTGRELNAVSGEHFFRYRTYSASTGSFFSRDPLGYVDGMSVYNGYFATWLRYDAFGLAPNQGGMVDPKSVAQAIKSMEKLKKNGQPAFNRKDILLNMGEDYRCSGKRYMYTEEYGPVDLAHFFNTAFPSMVTSSALTQIVGFIIELIQWATEGPNDYQSGFSSEDLLSNQAGANFGGTIDVDSSISEVFNEWAADAGAQDVDTDADWYNALPVTDPAE